MFADAFYLRLVFLPGLTDFERQEPSPPENCDSQSPRPELGNSLWERTVMSCYIRIPALLSQDKVVPFGMLSSPV